MNSSYLIKTKEVIIKLWVDNEKAEIDHINIKNDCKLLNKALLLLKAGDFYFTSSSRARIGNSVFATINHDFAKPNKQLNCYSRFYFHRHLFKWGLKGDKECII